MAKDDIPGVWMYEGEEIEKWMGVYLGLERRGMAGKLEGGDFSSNKKKEKRKGSGGL